MTFCRFRRDQAGRNCRRDDTCPAVTTLCGLINGAIIFDLNVPAMIATLGTQNVIRGIVKLLCGALKAIYEKGLRIPEDISFISYGKPELSLDMTTSEFFFAYLLQNGRKHDIT